MSGHLNDEVIGIIIGTLTAVILLIAAVFALVFVRQRGCKQPPPHWLLLCNWPTFINYFKIAIQYFSLRIIFSYKD